VKKLAKNNRIYIIAIVTIVVIVVASVAAVLFYQGQNNSNTESPSTTVTGDTGYTESPSTTVTGDTGYTESPSTTVTNDTGYTEPLSITVTDDTGYTLTMTQYAQRIVSLAPANTQMVFAVGAGDKVKGVTDWDHYPYNFSAWIEAGNMTSIGGFSTPNKEAIVGLQPDLILASTINTVDVANLRGLGYNVLVIEPASVQGVFDDLLMVGKVTGQDDAANALVANLTDELNTISDKIAAANITDKPKVYYEVYAGDQLMTIGSGCWINDVIAKAGGVNIFENITDAFPYVSAETVVQKNPDVVLVSATMGTDSYNEATITSRDGWGVTNAVKNNRIVIMDGDLFQEAGPRIVEQVLVTAEALYPDLFNSP
jgi:iron complex transport system substrate-binding protein